MQRNQKSTQPSNSESKKQKFKVFIGGLPPKITEEELRSHFENSGLIKSCEIIKDVNTQEPRGFAFIVFADEESYQKAISTSQTIKGRRIECKPALSKQKAKIKSADEKGKKQFIGGLSLEATDNDQADYFSKFGDIYKAYLIYDKNSNTSRGFGFVEFKSFLSADAVIKQKDHYIKEKLIECKKIMHKSEIEEVNSKKASVRERDNKKKHSMVTKDSKVGNDVGLPLNANENKSTSSEVIMTKSKGVDFGTQTNDEQPIHIEYMNCNEQKQMFTRVPIPLKRDQDTCTNSSSSYYFMEDNNSSSHHENVLFNEFLSTNHTNSTGNIRRPLNPNNYQQFQPTHEENTQFNRLKNFYQQQQPLPQSHNLSFIPQQNLLLNCRNNNLSYKQELSQNQTQMLNGRSPFFKPMTMGMNIQGMQGIQNQGLLQNYNTNIVQPNNYNDTNNNYHFMDRQSENMLFQKDLRKKTLDFEKNSAYFNSFSPFLKDSERDDENVNNGNYQRKHKTQPYGEYDEHQGKLQQMFTERLLIGDEQDYCDSPTQIPSNTNENKCITNDGLKMLEIMEEKRNQSNKSLDKD